MTETDNSQKLRTINMKFALLIIFNKRKYNFSDFLFDQCARCMIICMILHGVVLKH